MIITAGRISVGGTSPAWEGALPGEPMRWVINREGATTTEKVILWARLDLFPEEPETIEEPTQEIEIKNRHH